MILGGLSAALALTLSAAWFGQASLSSADEALRFEDPAITESSGLVVVGDTFITTNDSGDSGRLFVVDRDSGKTLRQVKWDDSPEDVEALAPAARGGVWAGDIGDNGADRDDVSVSWVDLAEVAPTRTYDVSYQAGPADAEALLSHPQTGQLFIATKSVFGGELLALPTELRKRKSNLATPVGRVSGLITDGAFFPDGKHFILRNYTKAFVYAYPTVELVGEFDLPENQQGEGLAVGASDRIHLSSEGIQAPILAVRVPADLWAAMRPDSTAKAPISEEPSPSPHRATALPDPKAEEPSSPSANDQEPKPPWLWIGALALLGAGSLLAVWVNVRHPDRRRR